MINIQRLQGLGLEATASLVLAGPVLSDVPDDFEETVRVWEANVPQAVVRLRFRPTDIYSLAESLVGQAPKSRPLDTRERESIGKLISILVEMNGLDGMGHYKAGGILLTEAARLKLSPLSINTIVAYLRLDRLPSIFDESYWVFGQSQLRFWPLCIAYLALTPSSANERQGASNGNSHTVVISEPSNPSASRR